ncbi:uncharacterized protein [Primulina eburnea]|uniref:uncharacterized protein n=1 Tax=Primulina eburnea TaxID=1245227 RepID=UPI003C6C53D9
MKLACWNVRGFHKPLKQKSAQSIMTTHKLDIFGILESKFDEKALNAMLRLRFRGMNAIHNFQFSIKGRIFVLWNSTTVDLDVICMSDQFIHVRIKCLKTEFCFYTSFVYGLHTICQRRLLWKDLLDIGNNCNIPWMVLGDFNNVLSPDEKLGGLKVKNYETKDFVDCFNSLDLSDLRHIGCYYTWMSHQVCSKLDRVLVNNHWLTSNTFAIAEFMVPGCVSDHSMSIVVFRDTEAPKKKPFKFFNMWALSDNFEALVSDAWRYSGGGTAQYRLKQMFKSLKKPLQRMNQQQFSHISSRAFIAKQNLMAMQESLLIDGVSQVGYKEVRRKAELLLEAERLFVRTRIFRSKEPHKARKVVQKEAKAMQNLEN